MGNEYFGKNVDSDDPDEPVPLRSPIRALDVCEHLEMVCEVYDANNSGLEVKPIMV